jgi:hypothetical protein
MLLISPFMNKLFLRIKAAEDKKINAAAFIVDSSSKDGSLSQDILKIYKPH